MAKGAYVGVDGVARKIKKGYIGVDGVARKIKKAYIGVGGVARPCWGGDDPLVYYGAITPLSVARYGVTGASIGNYALFAGGVTGTDATDEELVTTVDAYNTSLTRKTASALIAAAENPHTAKAGSYVLFGGTDNRYDRPLDVTAYNSSLSRLIADDLFILEKDVYSRSAATVGNYALFAGGRVYVSATNTDETDTVIYYDSSLTNEYADSLSVARGDFAGVTVGNYAVFAGGSPSSNNYAVDAYNTSMTQQTLDDLEYGRQTNDFAAVTIGNYGIIPGRAAGGGSGSYSDVVDVWDKSLTHSFAESLVQRRNGHCATVLGNYAIIGMTYSGADSGVNFDIYDSSLTHTVMPHEINDVEGEYRYAGAAATVGNYAIFAGGTHGTDFLSTAHAYTLPTT